MVSFVMRSLLIGATIFGGIVAGFSVNRMLVELPVWNQLGAEEWSRFARLELSRGLVVYPFEGLIALALSLGAAICYHMARSARRQVGLPLYIGALAAVLAFLVTRFLIAPQTLGLKDGVAQLGNLQMALMQTRRWWPIKAGLHLLTFACNVWGLVAMFGPQPHFD